MTSEEVPEGPASEGPANHGSNDDGSSIAAYNNNNNNNVVDVKLAMAIAEKLIHTSATTVTVPGPVDLDTPPHTPEAGGDYADTAKETSPTVSPVAQPTSEFFV